VVGQRDVEVASFTARHRFRRRIPNSVGRWRATPVEVSTTDLLFGDRSIEGAIAIVLCVMVARSPLSERKL